MNVPSAGVPLAGLGLARPRFPLGTELPCHGDDANEHTGRDKGVCSPVAGLGVPTTCW